MKKQVHRPGAKLALTDFNKAYAEKMEALTKKRQEKQETIARETEKGNSYAPAINKFSRKILEAGSIANVKAKKDQQQPTTLQQTQFDGISMISEATTAQVSAIDALGTRYKTNY